ncbi:uncharacterized protein SPAPADRAFT_51056 [Spathaspora passalidarum NRRL Y-27907]|uniref:Uncharacterized protein n=1 Tax=Spathaspora passalidarum (strain NRRL Y-27907 / 11-Y1) TaxID=619300 RepID=G3ANC3_SPAPN|nr:uncharacterized protein SPAPADRAFT_51056 [Spathaspora passalidarum NRRL Y-27907]EGW32506.1 hypothetical protein SPAPADRAFT_51056 [Spathaspora passalidarum NRRL Y-27907]
MTLVPNSKGSEGSSDIVQGDLDKEDVESMFQKLDYLEPSHDANSITAEEETIVENMGSNVIAKLDILEKGTVEYSKLKKDIFVIIYECILGTYLWNDVWKKSFEQVLECCCAFYGWRLESINQEHNTSLPKLHVSQLSDIVLESYFPADVFSCSVTLLTGTIDVHWWKWIYMKLNFRVNASQWLKMELKEEGTNTYDNFGFFSDHEFNCFIWSLFVWFLVVDLNISLLDKQNNKDLDMNFVANLHDDSFQVYENLEEYEAESLFRKLGLEPATDDHIEAVLLASTDYEAFKCHV